MKYLKKFESRFDIYDEILNVREELDDAKDRLEQNIIDMEEDLASEQPDETPEYYAKEMEELENTIKTLESRLKQLEQDEDDELDREYPHDMDSENDTKELIEQFDEQDDYVVDKLPSGDWYFEDRDNDIYEDGFETEEDAKIAAVKFMNEFNDTMFENKKIKNWKQFEAKNIKEDTTDTKLNVGSLIQIVDADDKNIGQAKIKKSLKTMYHVYYKTKNYKISKKDVTINVHGQAQAILSKLK